MKIFKTLAIAIALTTGAASLALARRNYSNAAASGGSGTHQSSQNTGSAANNQRSCIIKMAMRRSGPSRGQ